MSVYEMDGNGDVVSINGEAMVPVSTELRRDFGGGFYVEQWLCDPPDIGVRFQVLAQDWDESGDVPVRIIREIRLT